MIFCGKLNRRTLIIAILAAGVLLCGIILLAGNLGKSAEAFGGEISSKNIKSTEDRVEFLNLLGWEVDPDSEEVQEVLIPSEFNEAYLEYNELQLTQGCDLTRYSGKRARRYTYEITNYPTGEAGVTASLLIYNKTVIGGDVCSSRLDGFMHGLLVD